MPIVRRILTQRRQCDTVMQRETAEFQRFEKLGHILAGVFGDESSARRRVLGGREVGNARSGFVDIVWLFFDVRFDGVVGGHFGGVGGVAVWMLSCGGVV